MTRLIAVSRKLQAPIALFLFVFAAPLFAQTYRVGTNSTVTLQPQSGKATARATQLGWGSNIRSARLARAAQIALTHGNNAAALDYAERAARSAPADVQLWLLFGYAAQRARQYEQSVAAYKHALRLDPSSLTSASGLAQTYSLMGRTRQAEQLLDKVVAEDPKQRDDLMLLGNLYLQQDDYSKAVSPLQQADHLKASPRSELLLAIAYEHLKKLQLASQYLDAARKRAPHNPDVKRALAQYYSSTHDYPKAIEELRSIRSPSPDVVAELAYTYELDGQLQKSAKLYARAAHASPHDFDLQIAAAQAELSIRSVPQARVFLDRAASINPADYRLHSMRAQIARNDGNNQKAAREYSAALATLPAFPSEGPLYRIQLHMDLKRMYRILGEPNRAQHQLEVAGNEIKALHLRGSDRAAFLRLRSLIELESDHPTSALHDVQESLALTPNDPNSLMLEGQVFTKLRKTTDSVAAYKHALAIEPHNQFALISLGYALRAAGNDRQAEIDFRQLAHNDPRLYVPFLALGDLYTERRRYKVAETYYARAYALAPDHSAIVAGGVNASIGEHDLTQARIWMRRVTRQMKGIPIVIAQEERYYNLTGHYQESATLGRKAIQSLPDDRDVVVYLGYDLLHLKHYNELKALTDKYMNVFPHEPDIPLLAGYVDERTGHDQLAINEFTEALDRNSKVVTAYTNRGFLLNDLHRPAEAASNFEEAIRIQPEDGRAHLGLAFADLAMNRSAAALSQANLAERGLGDSQAIYVIRATAYGREGLLKMAVTQYRAALRFTPNSGSLHFGLGNVYFAEHRYESAIEELRSAQHVLPSDPAVYALMARSYAHLQNRTRTLQAISLAERYAAQIPTTQQGLQPSDIYVSTGEAFSTLGDRQAAMQRFRRALLITGSNRVHVRLAIARLMANRDQPEEANRQIALAQMEAEAGVTPRMTGGQYLQAANIFQQLHEYQLAQSYLQRAKAAGAPDLDVGIALADNYLALGETSRAAAELGVVRQDANSQTNYAFLLAEANVEAQEQHSAQALSVFAQAANASGGSQVAEDALLNAGGTEGYRVNSTVSLLSRLAVQPIFEDSTVYVLDAKLDSPRGPVPSTDVAQLPPPRDSVETTWTTAYHLHLGRIPTTGGFLQVRNTRGTISVPATDSIVNRNTTDTTMNLSIAPSIHLGSNIVTFDSGVQGTIRTDSLSPVQMDQNIFRVFTYLSTSSFFNAVSMDGYFIRDTGPFTRTPIYERSLAAALNFRVGAPWSNTHLVTGWGVNDQNFDSSQLGNVENYFTSSYIGLSHRTGTHLNVQAIVEDVRSWRVVPYSPLHSSIAQGLRPAGTVDISPSRRWHIHLSTAFESTRGFHVYDVTQNSFALSYTRPAHQIFTGRKGKLQLVLPIRLSAGVQEQTFINFTQGTNTQFVPYISIKLF